MNKRPKVPGQKWCTTHAAWASEKGGGWIYPKMPPKRGTNKRWACAACMSERRKHKVMSNTIVAKQPGVKDG